MSMILVTGLIAAMTIGGALAYLTGEDSDVNVMTLGNVSITQHEFEREVNADGDFQLITSDSGQGYKLKPFTQNKPLMPAVGSETQWDETVVNFDQIGPTAEGYQAPLADLANVQDKFVLVENTGSADAYVRTIIAFEVGNRPDAYGNLIHTVDGESWTKKPIGTVQIQNNQYYLVEYIYNDILSAGKYTPNSLAQVYMSSSATNEDVAAIDGNGNGTYDILVLSQAVQAAGFSDAKDALDEAFGPVDSTWFDEIVIPEGPADYNGDGEIIVADEGDPSQPAIVTQGGTIEDLTLESGEGTKSGIGSTETAPIAWDLNLNRVNIITEDRYSTEPVYALHGPVVNGVSVYVRDSVLEGDIDLSGDIGKLRFESCFFSNDDIEKGEFYTLILHGNTEFEGCDFRTLDEEVPNRIKIIPGAELAGGQKKTLSFNDCIYNEDILTADNIWDNLLTGDGYSKADYLAYFDITVDGVQVTE